MKDKAIREGYKRIVEEYDVKKNSSKPPFRLVGRGGRNKLGESMNLIYEMGKMTKPELWLITQLEASLDYKTNEARLVTGSLSNSHKGYLYKGFKALNAKGIVKRVMKQHYMINPRFIIPNDFEYINRLWNGLPN